MAIIKLEPGVPVGMVVKGAHPAQGQFGPQIKFTDAQDNALFVSSKTAEQQLGRAGLTVDEVVGLTLTFEKVVKDGRTFTNISANATRVPPKGEAPSFGAIPGLDEQDADERRFVETVKSGAPALTHAQLVTEKLNGLFGLYDTCLAHAASVAKQHGLPMEVIPSMAATCFIAAKDKGLAA